MSEDEDRAAAVVRRFWDDVWSSGRSEILTELFDESMLENGEPVDVVTFQEVVRRWTQEIFPDFKANIEELIPIGDGRVLSRVTYSGTQKLPWAGLPASERRFEVVGIDIFKVREGKIIELWHAVDHYDMAAQLGGKLSPATM